MKPIFVIVCLSLAFSLGYNVWLNWCLNTAHDRRPAGNFLRVRGDLPVYARGKNDKILTLPAGFLVQESTPHGAATLGKEDGHEYILIIHSKGDLRSSFEAASKSDFDKFWVPFSFDPNDHDIFEEPPYDNPDAIR